MKKAKRTNEGYWHTELKKAQEALIAIEDSDIASEIKEYICEILKNEIERNKFSIKYIGD